ncbi:uncharacterized protein LOC120355814 [Nilaparvata lugens]|uniref:uncharacterized protein LOC120355814 n=1 Tax=Nilaparvata lugens TaxID=108931 RepID=UPI00193CDA6F|nr:uncharacterized protein LOC120355814 [Nilaparvata lugens]
MGAPQPAQLHRPKAPQPPQIMAEVRHPTWRRHERGSNILLRVLDPNGHQQRMYHQGTNGVMEDLIIELDIPIPPRRRRRLEKEPQHDGPARPLEPQHDETTRPLEPQHDETTRPL